MKTIYASFVSILLLSVHHQTADAFAYIDPSGSMSGGVSNQPNENNNDVTLSSSLPPGCDPTLLQQHAQFAHELAEAARAEILPYWRQSRHSLGQETKLENDRSVFQSASPVTIADRAAERAMRDLIGERFPEHGVYGEEYGVIREDADWVWVLDPIDGTRSFITGKPLFGTLISCLYKGTPVIGVIDQCVLNERWLGLAGQVSTLNGEPIKTDGVNSLNEAEMYSTTPDMFQHGDELNKFNAMRQAVKTPHYGADCYAYALVASGFGADIVVEADLGLYDYCALVPVIQGAGGSISDWNGMKLSLQNHDLSKGRVVACANTKLHEQALEILSKPSSFPLDDPSLKELEKDTLSSMVLPRAQNLTPWVGGFIVGDVLEQILRHGP